jgi:hypothetical protein
MTKKSYSPFKFKLIKESQSFVVAQLVKCVSGFHARVRFSVGMEEIILYLWLYSEWPWQLLSLEYIWASSITITLPAHEADILPTLEVESGALPPLSTFHDALETTDGFTLPIY